MANDKFRLGGYDDIEELLDCWNHEGQLNFCYDNREGVRRYFGVEEDARGANIWFDDPSVEHEEFSFKDLDDLLDNYIGPDGVTIREVINGVFED